VTKYVQPDATLGDDPVFQLPGDWGITTLSGADLIPDARYIIRIDDGQNLTAPFEIQMHKFGDLDLNGIINFADILSSVLAFRNGQTGPFVPLGDIEPCAPNGVIKFADILQVVLVFQGRTFADLECEITCN
jgi:hypothetical protein